MHGSSGDGSGGSDRNDFSRDGQMNRKVVVKAAAMLGIGFVVGGWAVAARADDSDARFGGLSAGIHAGVARGRSDYGTDANCPPVVVDAVFCNAAPDPSAVNGQAVGSSGSGRASSNGAAGGVQIAYNWQADRLVYGGEADFSLLDIDETASANGTFPFAFAGTQYSVTNRTAVKWMSTLRGRWGMIVAPQMLLYATGGVALAQIKVSGSYSDNANNGIVPGGSGSASSDKVKAGWVLGGGAQWAFDRHWSLKAEYLYTDFDPISVDVPLTNSPAFTQTITVNSEVSLHLLRIGLDRRF
jgi:outer membrane immunogenic protein